MSTPWRSRASVAPVSSRSVTRRLKRETTMAMASPWPFRSPWYVLPTLSPLEAAVPGLQQVSQLPSLRLQVADVVGVRLDDDGDTLHHLEAIALQAGPFGRVVGEQSHLVDAQVHQDLHADAVV